MNPARAGTYDESEARWAEWMVLSGQGDRSAYQKLLEEIAEVMHAYLRRNFGDGDFVEDCVQECLLSIHRARNTYDPKRKFRPWMFAIVRHKAIDFLRRGGMRSRLGADLKHRNPTSDAGTSAEDSLQVSQLLAGLQPKYRDALVLTKLYGYSVSDSAARAGVSTTAMKTRVHRAIGQMRRRLEEEEA